MKITSRTHCAWLVWVAILGAFGLTEGRAAVLFQDNFDSGTVGASISAGGWSLGSIPSGSGTALYNNTTAIGGNSAQIINTEASASVTRYVATHALSGAFDWDGTDVATIKFSLNMSQTNRQFTIQLPGSGGQTNFAINMSGFNDPVVYVSSTAGFQAVGAFTINTWYDFTITLYAATNTFDYERRLHSDGSLVGPALTGLGITNPTSDPTQFQMLLSGANGANPVAYVDNILITTVPEPTALMLGFLGGGFMLMGRRKRSRK